MPALRAYLNSGSRSHRDKLFRSRRVNADGRIELGLRRTHLDSDGDPLDDLRSVASYHMCAQHHLIAAVHNELHEYLFIPSRQSVP